MSWASSYIAMLCNGQEVTFRPRGRSMEPRVHDGQQVTVRPLGEDDPVCGAVVLCAVKGRQYLHLVKAISRQGNTPMYLIGNNKGGVNGWIGRHRIYGVML